MLRPSQRPCHVPDQALAVGRWHPVWALTGLHGWPLPPPGPAPGLQGEVPGQGAAEGPEPRRGRAYRPATPCFRRSRRLVAGAPGDRGVTALEAVGAVSSSPPATARGLSPGMAASTARAAAPASAPAAPRTARQAQVRPGAARAPPRQQRAVTLPFLALPWQSGGERGQLGGGLRDR